MKIIFLIYVMIRLYFTGEKVILFLPTIYFGFLEISISPLSRNSDWRFLE